MKPEKVLVLGATGAMARYMIPFLAENGCLVDGINPDPYQLAPRWQLEYARLFDREVDNSKVLAVTGLKQSDTMPLYDGLKMEISRTPKDYPWPNNQRMDDYLAAMK